MAEESLLQNLVDALRLLLKADGIEVNAVASPDAALAAISSSAFDLLLMDLNYTSDTTSGREGIDLLSRVQTLDSLLPVVVMTGWGSVDLAVESMRRGVKDFVQKPWDNAQLVATLRAEIDEGRARRQRQALEQREHDEARRIQRKLLPSTLPAGSIARALRTCCAWRPRARGSSASCMSAPRSWPGASRAKSPSSRATDPRASSTAAAR